MVSGQEAACPDKLLAVCPAQVPALKRHLAATLKSAEEFLAEADVQQQQQAVANGRPATPSPQEQRRRQARVESHPVETVCALLACWLMRHSASVESKWEAAWHRACPHHNSSSGAVCGELSRHGVERLLTICPR